MSLQRVKLFRLQTKSSISEFKKVFSENEYFQQEFGFYNVDVDEDVLYATYTEKQEHNEETYDPYGNYVSNVKYVNYKSIRFHIEKLSPNNYILALYEPPNATKSFFDNFADIFNYRVGFTPLNIDINKFVSMLSEVYSIPLVGTGKLKVSRVILNDNSKASIEISSIKDSFEALKNFLGDRTFNLDQISSSFYYEGSTIDFQLSKLGSVKVREEHKTLLISLIKVSLDL
ncbi:hypothetical protein A9259_08040 [Vibrio cyclitrophicus]|uniref:hypothetical protein n=1 Tax=Vibrio cyclitrophicus TaxID=47951 RepID=UPI0007EEF110|nr:hypothetical protein [Vibrio cyclitrophicus]OBS98399.1 hypothetical protein A9259_08040 [Vibrio cyclitrophicus]